MKGGSATVLAVLLAVVVADHHEDHLNKPEEFLKIDHRLDSITYRLETIKEAIKSRTDPAKIQEARSFRERVVALEGDGCGYHEYQCGGADPQCVSVLFVCDGRKDCRNGHDEEDCALPTKTGDIFEGHVIYDKCTKRQPDYMGFEITSVKHAEFFNPVHFTTLNMYMDHEGPLIDGHVSLPAKGGYYHGLHALIVVPPERDGLGMVCRFDGHNNDRCVGEIMFEATMNVCAKIIFTRREQKGDH